MSAFHSDFFEKREINGINMYIIPSGTTLYRGDSNFTDINHSDLLKGDYKFFTPDQEYADKYGIVFEFKTNKELQLIALDDISKDFFVSAPEEIQDILEDNYGYISHKRDSVEEKDYKVSQYICDQGYQGYAANTMESKGFDDDLDAEIVLCNAEQYLDRIKRVTEENRIQSKQDKLKLRKIEERASVGPSNKPRRDIEDRPKPPSMGSLFEDDEEDDDDFQPSRRLFGGKTKKAKKSKKQSKKKKSKTQKKRKSRKSKIGKK